MITAPAIGPTLSGYIVEYYDWRLLFEMILPLAIISLLLGIWKSENVMRQNKNAKLDYLSLLLSSVGFGGLLYGFSSASSDGWTNKVVLTTLIIGAIALIAFIIRQLKMNEPLLDLRVYKYPMFALASVIAIVNAVAMFSGDDFNTGLCTKCPWYFAAELWADDASRCGNNGSYVTHYR